MKKIVVIAFLALAAPAWGQATLSKKDGRAAAAYTMRTYIAPLLDGKGKVGDCRRVHNTRLDCYGRVIGPENCTLRIIVRGEGDDYNVSIRDIRCR